MLDRPLNEIVKYMVKDTEGSIYTNWPVSSVTYIPTKWVEVKSASGSTIRAKHVVVAVPANALKEDLQFHPPLPDPHRQAIQGMRMGNALKVTESRKPNPPSTRAPAHGPTTDSQLHESRPTVRLPLS